MNQSAKRKEHFPFPFEMSLLNKTGKKVPQKQAKTFSAGKKVKQGVHRMLKIQRIPAKKKVTFCRLVFRIFTAEYFMNI